MGIVGRRSQHERKLELFETRPEQQLSGWCVRIGGAGSSAGPRIAESPHSAAAVWWQLASPCHDE